MKIRYSTLLGIDFTNFSWYHSNHEESKKITKKIIKKVGFTMIEKQNTNEKKTLKKGRKGWVISAAIVALLGI